MRPGEKEGKQTNQKTPKAFTYFDSDPYRAAWGARGGQFKSARPDHQTRYQPSALSFNCSHRSGRRTKKSTFDRADQSLTIEKSSFAPRWLRATSSKVFPERGSGKVHTRGEKLCRDKLFCISKIRRTRCALPWPRARSWQETGRTRPTRWCRKRRALPESGWTPPMRGRL
jgi:hypothetical protein